MTQAAQGLTLTPQEINGQITIPEAKSSSPVSESQALKIYNFLKEHPEFSETLEVGFAIGRSAAHIIAATGKHHQIIDPFQEDYGSWGVKNLKKLGLDGLYTLHKQLSHDALPQLLAQGQKFDFIFIDGDHRFDGAFIDFYYADLLLKPGGYVLLHDTWMRPIRLIMSFINNNRANYSLKLDEDNLGLYQKVSETDERDGMHFKEFYTSKSYARHHITMRAYENPSGLINKLKEALKGLMKK
jgi:predicted O-methyltransferase YrrM